MPGSPRADRHPLIFEANAHLLLRRLSRRYGRRLSIGTVPLEYWRELGSRFQFVWLMGVWERSDASRSEALADPALQQAYAAALADWSHADVGGSPYAVRCYRLDPALGHETELATLRKRLADAGLGLIVDFVPNHVARDHPWTLERPEFIVRPDAAGARANPHWFFTTSAGQVLAHGRDPYFPPWTDTAQLDFTSSDLRRALIDELLSIAEVSDGVRCDMAMLALNDVHRDVWCTVRSRDAPVEEFWSEAIARVRRDHPRFLFIAEAYWGLEPRLVELGFDYAYDKGLYDAMGANADAVRRHLARDPLGARGLRFIENHDEPRAAAAFGLDRAIAAATIAATLPGALLIHDGQLEGRRKRLPVQLLREPDEPPDAAAQAAYDALLRAVNRPPIGTGTWKPLHVDALERSDSAAIFAWRWNDGANSCVVVVNYSAAPGDARLVVDDVPVESPAIVDRLPAGSSGSAEVRPSATVDVTLGPWQARIMDLVIVR